jgi:hypothetical protein
MRAVLSVRVHDHHVHCDVHCHVHIYRHPDLDHDCHPDLDHDSQHVHAIGR